MLRSMQQPETPDENERVRAAQSSTPELLHGAGALCVIGGVLAGVAVLITPELVWTFAPIAVVGIGGGVALTRWGRTPN